MHEKGSDFWRWSFLTVYSYRIYLEPLINMRLIKIFISIQIVLSNLRPTVWPWPLTTCLRVFFLSPLYFSLVYAKESIRKEAPCYSWSGTIWIPLSSCSKAQSAEWPLHNRQRWHLQMSEIFSSGTFNNKKTDLWFTWMFC